MDKDYTHNYNKTDKSDKSRGGQSNKNKTSNSKSKANTKSFMIDPSVNSLTKYAKDSMFGDSAYINRLLKHDFYLKYYKQENEIKPKQLRLSRDRESERRRETTFQRRNSSVTKQIKNKIKESKGFSKDKKVLKERYNRTFGYSTPFIDSELYPYLDRVPTNPLRGRESTVRKSDIQNSDAESVRKYCTSSRFVSTNTLKGWIFAGRRAARDIGIFSNDSEKRKKPVLIRDAVKSVIKNTSAGYPTFVKKDYQVAIDDTISWISRIFDKPNYFDIVQKNLSFRYDKSEIPDDLMYNPAYIFHRFQAVLKEDFTDYVIKIRQVWCIPFRIVSLEYRYFGRFIEAAKEKALTSKTPVYSTGMRASEISSLLVAPIRNLLSRSQGELVYSIDYSKFDQTIPSWAIDIFFAIVASQIKFTTLRDLKTYEYLRMYIKHTPFIHEGEIKIQKRGMCSGSLITNLFDTWWNLTIWYYVEFLQEVLTEDEILRFSLEPDELNRLDFGHVDFTQEDNTINSTIKVCGDDTLLIAGSRKVELHRCVCFFFGIGVTHKEPVSNSKDPFYFLGRFWDDLNRPFQQDEWFCIHLGFRTRRFKGKKGAPSGTELTLSRALSVCLPFANGLTFLETYLWDWPPLVKYFKEKIGFYDTREYPDQNFRFVSYQESLDWKNFG